MFSKYTDTAVLEARNGNVLTVNTILKLDHYIEGDAASAHVRTSSTSKGSVATSSPNSSGSSLVVVNNSNNSTSSTSNDVFRFSGALNFRQTKYTPTRSYAQAHNVGSGATFPIYACSQPAVFGVRAILNFLQHAAQLDKKPNSPIIWINLREEVRCTLLFMSIFTFTLFCFIIACNLCK